MGQAVTLIQRIATRDLVLFRRGYIGEELMQFVKLLWWLSRPLLAVQLGEYWFRICLYVYDRN
jgi:hypothetical protein